jgi:hypothetical protein
VRETVDDLVARKPSFVIIASESSDYVNGAGFSLLDTRSGRTARSPATKAQFWRAGLQRVLQRLQAASIPTLVVNSIPHFGSWDPRTCAAIVVAGDLRACGTSRRKTSVENDQRAVNAAEVAATEATAAHVVNFTPTLCSSSRCSTNNGNTFTYMDGHHLSVDGALTLEPQFDRLIRQDARS